MTDMLDKLLRELCERDSLLARCRSFKPLPQFPLMEKPLERSEWSHLGDFTNPLGEDN